jgi:hypothetical protein
MVRCRLSGPNGGDDTVRRYVPLAEFGLWKYLMETRHRRRVLVEAISVWVPEEPALWNSGYAAEDLDPVLRIQFTTRGPLGAPVPVVRYFPALGYPRAQEALLSHFADVSHARDLSATAGYFLPLYESVSATQRSSA